MIWMFKYHATCSMAIVQYYGGETAASCHNLLLYLSQMLNEENCFCYILNKMSNTVYNITSVGQ